MDPLTPLFGTPGDDRLRGTASAEKEEIFGRDGNDTISLGDGDVGRGGTGKDSITLVGEGSTAYGGRKNDTINIIASNTTAFGDQGDDTIQIAFDADNVCVSGGTGADTYLLTLAPIRLIGPAPTVPPFVRATIKDFQVSADKLEVTVGAGMRITYSGVDSDLDGQQDAVNVTIFNPSVELSQHTRVLRLENVDLASFENNIDRIFCAFGGNPIPRDLISEAENFFQRNATFDGTSRGEAVQGGDGRQTVNLKGGKDTTFLGNGNDTARMGKGADVAFGEAGNDRLFMGGGNDFAIGGDGDDHLEGGGGNDVLNGGAGVNILIGGSGEDTFALDLGGGARNTIMDFNIDQDRFAIGDAARLVFNSKDVGNDGIMDVVVTIKFGAKDVSKAILLGRDLQNFSFDALDIIDGSGNAVAESQVRGLPSGGNNGSIITGTDGEDILTGTDGDDTIDAGAGDDRVEAGAGNDTILASTGRDTLFGGDGNDIITGQAGEIQFLHGEGGNDRLIIKNQNNGIGGDGADTFVFTDDASSPVSAKGGDFDVFEDKLIVNNGVTDVQLIDVSFPNTTITRAVLFFGKTSGPIIDLGASALTDAQANFANWLMTEGGGTPNWF